MSVIWQASTAVLWLVTWLSSPPASLGDMAAREAMRRQASPKAAATLTNLGQPIEPPPPPAVSLPGNNAATPPASTAPVPAPAAAGGPEPAHDEAWWRGRITTAKEALAKDQLMAQALQSRIDALQRDVVNIDDPVRQNKARQDREKALSELERMQRQIETDQKAIATINDEGRRQNVPAGWIR